MPALFGGTYPSFPLILVDEAQDLNPTNHELLKRLAKNARVCAVGDCFQSIYGFRGAVQNGMAKLREQFKMDVRTISYSFRCPENIVRNVHWRVPDYKWTKPGGHVEALKELDINHVQEGASIICRNNAPMVRLGFSLLSAKRSVQIAGSELGPKIIRMMEKLGDDNTPRDHVIGRIADWRSEKLATSNSPATVDDIAECM